MSERPWSQFFWNDWSGDVALQCCTLAAQGLWMRILCICAEADPYGYALIGGRPVTPDQLARMTGQPVDAITGLLDELDHNGVFSRDRNGAIYSRRMIRDAAKSAKARTNGAKGGNPSLSYERRNAGPVIPPDNLPRRSEVKPHKPESHKPESRNQDIPNGAASSLGSAREDGRYGAALLVLENAKAEALRLWGAEHGEALLGWQAATVAGWLSDGTEARIVGDALAGLLGRLHAKGKPPPRSLEYFAAAVSETKASTRRALPRAPQRRGGREEGTDWDALAGGAHGKG